MLGSGNEHKEYCYKTKEEAQSKKKELQAVSKNHNGGYIAVSVRKTKGWKTFSLLVTFHSFGQLANILKEWTPEHYNTGGMGVLGWEGKIPWPKIKYS